MFLILILLVTSCKPHSTLFTIEQFHFQMSALVFSLVAQRGKLPVAEPARKLLDTGMNLKMVPEAAPVLQLLSAYQVWALIFLGVLDEFKILVVCSQSLIAFLFWRS